MNWLLGRILCLAGRHRWVVSLHAGRPAIKMCRRCSLACEEPETGGTYRYAVTHFRDDGSK